MDDRLRFRALIAVSVNMRHNIVAEFLFIFRGGFIIYIVSMRFKLVYLLLCDIQPELFFGFRKRDPQLSPSLKLEIGRIDILHLFAGIAFRQGMVNYMCYSALFQPRSLHHLRVSVLYSAEITAKTVLIKFFVRLDIPEAAGVRADLVSKNDFAV